MSKTVYEDEEEMELAASLENEEWVSESIN
jgi:hypothetical protein